LRGRHDVTSLICWTLALSFIFVAARAESDRTAWLQFTSSDSFDVRAITRGDCPVVSFNGAPPVAMRVRASSDANFPSVCSLAVPPSTKSVRLDFSGGARLDLPPPVAEPQRILVLGDTGCRIKGSVAQACSDPVAWPFAGLAGAAANLKPDLVIHLGDYLYRESPCPLGNTGCSGSPFGDNWPSWNADFFSPARPLLRSAPWLFIRGNHEDCARSGGGFLRLLGSFDFDPEIPCQVHLAPFAVNAGAQSIMVMDNASASDTSVDEASVALYRADFAALEAMARAQPGQKMWLAAHRPIWAAISGPLGIPIGGNATLIAASGDLSAFRNLTLMLSGHIHTFEAINYRAKLPPQIVAGHGGDYLDVTPADLRGAIFQGNARVRVKDGLSIGGFGFLMLSKDVGGTSWSIQLYDSSGTPERECRFADGRVTCPSAN
jgi:Calcineurin-like phosphoesterase